MKTSGDPDPVTNTDLVTNPTPVTKLDRAPNQHPVMNYLPDLGRNPDS
jgi:hypothetical protein